MVGSVLGNRYRILREIGAGGMAKVYLAEDITENELVAVKVLYPQFSQDISFIQRFNREAKLASTLTDPHIVHVLDYGADRDLQYLVMEYVEGQDLNGLLKSQGPLEWRFALEVLDQLATALEHAHAHSVVHRDIKPQNMMLNENGLLKVLDFGIARIPTLPSLTQSGFIGSPYYASPEQAMGEEVDIRSDIYSSGIVLYELLSGNIPFDAKSPWSIISQHITSEPPPIELTEEEIPDHVKELLARMLAKRPDDRFQSPTALRQAIATVLAGQPVPSEAEATKPISFTERGALIDSLVERANKAIEVKEWARAVDLLGQAIKLDPNRSDLTEQLDSIEREAKLESLYKSGVRNLDNDRWEEAINHFNVIIELESNYKDTPHLLERAHEALKAQNAEQYTATRYEEGVAHFEAERWEGAVQAFAEVSQLAPDYERVVSLLAEAERRNNPTLTEKINRIFENKVRPDMWRWGLVTAGVIAISFLIFLAFGNNRASGDDDIEQGLKLLYEEAQVAIEAGNTEQAVTKLDEILQENPNYADAAALRIKQRFKLLYEEAQAAIEAGNTEKAVANLDEILQENPNYLDAAELKQQLSASLGIEALPSPTEDPFAMMVEEAQEAVDFAQWAEALELLNSIRKQDNEHQKAGVSSLLCDAYVGRGLEALANIDSLAESDAVVSHALADFEAGVKECPRRTDLADQSERAQAYLDALGVSSGDYETLIPTLIPIVAAEPDYAAGYAKVMLYNAYLGRATERREAPESMAAALGDYEAALALNVDDPGEAQTHRAELLLLFSQQPGIQATLALTQATPVADSGTPAPSTEGQPISTPAPRPQLKYGKPNLLTPVADSIFAGEFTEVILEWKPSVDELADDEYYDLTIMHLFADEPQYLGSRRTRETRIQLEPEIGVGQAGGDRFYWWVTVRKDDSALSSDSLDLPLSPRSDTQTFVWSP